MGWHTPVCWREIILSPGICCVSMALHSWGNFDWLHGELNVVVGKLIFCDGDFLLDVSWPSKEILMPGVSGARALLMLTSSTRQ